MALIFASKENLDKFWGKDSHTPINWRPMAEQFPAIVSWNQARFEKVRAVGYVITSGKKHIVLRITSKVRGQNKYIIADDWSRLYQKYKPRQHGYGLLTRAPDFLAKVDGFTKGEGFQR